ncbi:ribonucleoside-diphosphate reductase, adenosylcobalamin-dependent [candidate division LCP-89 bacterium B3_LCP]|uniref:Vitamin B12-dependent ribonucleotide reductase n=1 Tax=candidate division LCP-89 bacterium B3_LCP TaxID=2012998 RepID=A0A532UXN7_UNCL8|nr:MAG: ribonucleoside-diphosphate reductase, adenosylcobalamin-dependent [candidate division LCP-89 bacterium B3_LCP]
MLARTSSVGKRENDLFTSSTVQRKDEKTDKITLPKIKRQEKYSYSDNSLAVLKRRYLAKNDTGEIIETAEEMFRRVAKHVASAEKVFNKNLSDKDCQDIEDAFYHLMASLDFIPNSPTLMNAGRELGQLSACFVLPIEDSMEGIFNAIKYTALIHKSGGGTGFSFSKLREKNSVVKSTAGTASGPVSFMTVFNAATETIKQGGTRRGANMAILHVDHPDIEEFIDCKKGEHSLNNFNISVAVTDEFMDAVKNNLKFKLKEPRSGEFVRDVSAKKLFDKIVDNAWSNGEPGIVFLDQINRDNPTPSVGRIESTNPCGEQPLLPYESCNLGSINLDHLVVDDAIDWEKLAQIIKLSVRFLDDVIEVNKYPLPEIAEITRANRKIGLGVMGFADLLYQLDIPYNSAEGIKLGEEVMEFILGKAREASKELTSVRGTFPNFDKSIYDTPIRNATITTIAPTGTLSMIADCSGGVEPVFSLVYVKKVMDGQELLYVNHHFEKALQKAGIYSEELIKKISACKSLEEIEEIPEPLKRTFVTSHEIASDWHVRMQGAFQKHTDNAVSKTINFPHNATTTDVRRAYMLAYDLGCKGLTVYRDGSRSEQVMHRGDSAKKQETKKEISRPKLSPRKRPAVTYGMTERVNTGDGPSYVTINSDEHGPCEVFTSIGKAGGNLAAQSEAISRLISLCLKSGIAPDNIVKQLKGISGPNPVWENGTLITSAPDAIAKALERYIQRQEANSNNKPPIKVKEPKFEKDTNLLEIPDQCPDCGGPIAHEDGCLVCRSCGFTKCG